MLQLLEGKEQVGSYQTPKSLQASEFLCMILRMNRNQGTGAQSFGNCWARGRGGGR